MGSAAAVQKEGGMFLLELSECPAIMQPGAHLALPGRRDAACSTASH